MESAIVIKVQYGETLRRFSSRIVDGKFDLDMNTLREKILSLFSFPVGSELAFTYIDEDGDAVTLADEEDLHDIMSQSLNPLRLTVKLNTERCVKSRVRSSGNSTPVRSPQVQPVSQVMSTGVSEALKSLPDTVRETVPRLSMEFGFDTNSPEGYGDLLDSLAKIGLTCLKVVSVSHSNSGSLESSTNRQLAKDENSSIVVGTQVSEIKSCATDQEESTGFCEGSVPPATRNAKARDKTSTLLANKGPKTFNFTGGRKEDVEIKSCARYLKNGNNGSAEGDNGRYGHKIKEVKKSTGMEPLTYLPPTYVHELHQPHHLVPSKNCYNYSAETPSVFHKGIECDHCGVYPIIGTRFKSLVKFNYDLCSICFARVGSEAEYMRMDFPMNYQSHGPSSFNSLQHSVGRPPTLPSYHSKLNSCFIEDVNILDGTVMTPSTQFTKIWRMKNNGSIAWPHGTHLVWIGGSKFSETLSSELKISADGCPVDKEIDIAINFTAPVQLGRHISYWRMALPSGHQFGQSVWVHIQVDSSLKGSLGKNGHDFNLNLPPASSDLMMVFQYKKFCTAPIIGDDHVKTLKVYKESELLEPVVDTPDSHQGLHNPINETLLVAEPSVEVSSPVTYPVVDMSKVELVAVSAPPYSSLIGVGQGKDEVEQTLLKDLEQMGFMEVDLNKEILRKNEYDLEESIIDLCSVTEWDPLLKELQMMGFSDDKLNRMLLKKNNGSIKRVVMDLIAGED